MPKANRGIVIPALCAVFVHEMASVIEIRWDDLASFLAGRFPMSSERMLPVREAMRASRYLPLPQWNMTRRSNLFERANEEITRRTRMVCIFPIDGPINRLVGALLPAQDEHDQLKSLRTYLEAGMSDIAALDELSEHPSLQEATA